MALRRLQKQMQLLQCTRHTGYEVPTGFLRGVNATGAVAHETGILSITQSMRAGC